MNYHSDVAVCVLFFFFKQKTAYEIGLGIPAEPLFRSHGTMFTLALVRFPPTATKEIQYLNAKGALTYTDIAASGVVDIFHGIDKAVADTWNNFWKDGKADGIGSKIGRASCRERV